MPSATVSPDARAARAASPLSDLDLHFLLTRAMARRHGVSLSEAIRQGILSRADFDAMIHRCRTCPGAPADCAELAEDHEAAGAAPDWCGNRQVLEGLRGLV
ncbi:MAG: hypothetical protein JSR87_14450 [Proteobacteria bacterium]|nr:hypothetical protein [Pseudomonadota bacterium]MBS0572732.1 hypothetical protein [Pseudomonadota bacterium]